MARIERPDVDTMVANMQSVYTQAMRSEIFDGLTWYPTAYLEIVNMAARRNVHVNVAAAVVAATSPQMKWDRNVMVAEAMIVMWQAGLPIKGHTTDVTTKVAAILDSGSIDPAVLVAIVMGKKGFKTGNFYLNLLQVRNLENVQHVHSSVLRGTTTDRFHVGIAYGRYFGDNVPSMTAAQYNDISTATEIFAGKHGYSSEEAQAILWVIFRRLHGIV